MIRFTQATVTDDQADLISQALGAAADNEDLHEDDRKQLGRLQLLFADMSENPSKYPPTGERAQTVRSIIRRATQGEAQPQSRRNKRKARQERRMRTHKERRRLRKQIAESYNKAQEIMEAEKREAEEAWQEEQARIAQQPKYKVVTADGQVILDGIPAEFVLREETGENLLPKVIVPGA